MCNVSQGHSQQVFISGLRPAHQICTTDYQGKNWNLYSEPAVCSLPLCWIFIMLSQHLVDCRDWSQRENEGSEPSVTSQRAHFQNCVFWKRHSSWNTRMYFFLVSLREIVILKQWQMNVAFIWDLYLTPNIVPYYQNSVVRKEWKFLSDYPLCCRNAMNHIKVNPFLVSFCLHF